MSDVANTQALLTELESVLDAERQALRVLDHDGIARAAEDKLRIDAALQAAPLPSSTPGIKEQVARIRRTAQINQVLLAHARSCVQGMIQLLTGQGNGPVTRTGSAPPPPPVALDLRG
jgi:flagellar biosynthesis/type III secretory pathway chaperone